MPSPHPGNVGQSSDRPSTIADSEESQQRPAARGNGVIIFRSYVPKAALSLRRRHLEVAQYWPKTRLLPLQGFWGSPSPTIVSAERSSAQPRSPPCLPIFSNNRMSLTPITKCLKGLLRLSSALACAH
jgi:hypothetical protein